MPAVPRSLRRSRSGQHLVPVKLLIHPSQELIPQTRKKGLSWNVITPVQTAIDIQKTGHMNKWSTFSTAAAHFLFPTTVTYLPARAKDLNYQQIRAATSFLTTNISSPLIKKPSSKICCLYSLPDPEWRKGAIKCFFGHAVQPQSPSPHSLQTLPCTVMCADAAPGPQRSQRVLTCSSYPLMGTTHATNILIKWNPLGKSSDLSALPCQQTQKCKQGIALVPALGRDRPGNTLYLPALGSHCMAINFHIL